MNKAPQKKVEIVVGLDIGTTKIACLVGKLNEYNKVDILGVGKADSHGVLRGVVSNIDKTVEAIIKAVQEADQEANVTIKVVNVGIAGQHIKSLQQTGMITRSRNSDEISIDDIDGLIESMYNSHMEPGQEIVHVIPQEYIVDNESGIKDPIGMSGNRLEARFHIITGLVTAINNILKCVSKANLEIESLILEPIASAEAVLSEEEKEAGVALVDIGGGTTDIAIFHDGIIRHTAVIPFGGNIITEDIKEGCTVIKQHAELLKTRFGSALASEANANEVVSIPGLRGREGREISVSTLSGIIQFRMEEIIDMVNYEIIASGYKKKLAMGIVLTGGGAQLKNLIHLFSLKTGMEVKIGTPNEHIARGEADVKSPMYATGVGLVLLGFGSQRIAPKLSKETANQKVKVNQGSGKSPKSIFNLLWNKLKNILSEDDISQDKDFK